MVYLLDFAITFLVYSLPIIIYRYAINKAPVAKKLALKITVIYAICAGIVMAVILYNVNGRTTPGAALLLWSIVNYNVLKPHVTQITFDKNGKNVMYESTDSAAATLESLESEPVKTVPVQSAEPERFAEVVSGSAVKLAPTSNNNSKNTKQRFCKYCGGPIDPETKRCTRCAKQYIRAPKITKPAVVLAIIVGVFAGGIGFVCGQASNDFNAKISPLGIQSYICGHDFGKNLASHNMSSAAVDKFVDGLYSGYNQHNN